MNGFARYRPAAALIAAIAISNAFALRAVCADGLQPAVNGGDRLKPVTTNSASDAPSRKITPPNRPLRSASKTGAPRKTTAGSYWQTLLVLGGIVAVILLGAKYFRKHGPRLPGGIPNDALEVLGKRAIDRGQLIYLVRLGSRILIIGSSSGGLQTLGEVTDPVEIDFLSGLCRQPTQNSHVAQGFFALFNRQFTGTPATPPGPTATVRSGEPTHSDREEAHV